MVGLITKSNQFLSIKKHSLYTKSADAITPESNSPGRENRRDIKCGNVGTVMHTALAVLPEDGARNSHLEHASGLIKAGIYTFGGGNSVTDIR